MIAEVSTLEMWTSLYQSTQRNISEDSQLHTRNENLKSHQTLLDTMRFVGTSPFSVDC